MIPVARVPEPSDFDVKARKPGQRWLQANPKARRPQDRWSPYLSELALGFGNLCGYAAMLDPTGGTVDHYLSFKNYPNLAYEWSNYRFVSQILNAAKKTADDSVLDPYQVRPGWFEILLPSLQMRATDQIPQGLRTKAEYTLKRLKLRDGEKIVRWRQHWYELYQRGDLTLDGLREVAPLIADAVQRQPQGPAASPRKPKPTASPRKPKPTASPRKQKPTASPRKPEPTASPRKPKPAASPTPARPARRGSSRA